MDNSTISKLVVKYLKGNATESEIQMLSQWRQADVANDKLIHHFEQSESTLTEYRMYKSFDEDGVWDEIIERIETKKPKVTFGYILARVAAVLIVGLLITSIFYVLMPENNTSKVAMVESVIPGQFNAILTVGNQNNILLSDSTTQELRENDGLLANIVSGKLDYQFQNGVKPVEMEVVVPHRAEYNFDLSDGTKVWMNAGSRVIFKHPFLSDSRNVYVEGEVFFEVSKDKNRPFVVQLPNKHEIEVLGTEFNVRAYPDDVIWQSVLVEGSVLWRKIDGSERLMEPGQMLNYSVSMGDIKISEVDVYPYIAWKEGRFVYDGLELSKIMDDLSRWYGIDVVFKDSELMDLHFRVNIKRYENLNEILELITLTEKVMFEMNGSTIIVKKYK